MKTHRNIIFFVVLLAFVNWKETPLKVSYQGPEYRCEYETVKGMYHGDYTSWYPNGKKRAEGTFRDNIRCGTWTVYDSTGRKRMVRKYQNNFEFEQIFPRPSNEGPIPLFREPKWKPVHDSTGRIPYFYLEERAVVVSKRMWRYIPANPNHPIFRGNNFYHALIDSLIAGKVKAYEGPNDDEFRKELADEAQQQLIDTSKYEVIGYRLKEDWFFDKDRMISETRIIGLMPVCRNKSTSTDSFAPAWFYFPTLRPLLTVQKISDKTVPEYIHTLDDLFQFRFFSSWVYKESNYYERKQNGDVPDRTGVVQSQQRIRREMSLIEMEHDVWVSFSP